MKELVDIDDSLLRLANELTGQKEKSKLVNMGLRALIKKQPAADVPSNTGSATAAQAVACVNDEDHTPRQRIPGGWEDIWIADDFDETPEEFLK